MGGRQGRPILGAVSGVILGLFLAVDLMMFGVVPSDSAVFVVLPVVLMVLGVVLGAWAPLGRQVPPR